MAALLLLHLVAGVAGISFGERLGRQGLLLAGVPLAASVAWLVTQASTVLDGGVVSESIEWVPALGVAVDLRLDAFGWVMALLVEGIGLLVLLYGWSYFPRVEEGLGRLIGLLALFAGAMLGLVLADNLLVLYGFWELTSITSFLLIGNGHRDGKARAAALQALLVTGAGGLAMLAGFILLGQAAGTYRLSALLADPPEPTATVGVAVVLVLLGAFTKSAQVPFHSWLPGAMVAPTPVSAYLHSATMVKAGVYLIARFAPAMAGTVAVWRPLIAVIGATTMIVGGLRAMRQTDLKLLLAMGTVSQLGMMVGIFGWGTDEATAAGIVLLLGHAAFKATAFMVVGILDHQHGTRDLRALPRPGPGWGPTSAAAVAAAASMAGVPLLLGFVAKEGVLEALSGGGSATWLLVAITAGSALTVAYSLRYVAGTLGLLGRPVVVRRSQEADDGHGGRAPSLAFALPAVVLAGLSLVYGLAPSLLDTVDGAAASALLGERTSIHLAVWHGVNLALVLSLVAFAIGIALFLLRQPVERVLASGHAVPVTSSGLYGDSLRLMNLVADRTTGLVQFGSLPAYTGIILFTAAALPGVMLVTEGEWPGWPDLTTTWVHVPVVTVILTAALAAAAVRRRFTAALFLGVTGYAMAGLFVVQGAPDLALTQVGIETLTTVLFVLVLRRLPDRFESRTAPWRRGLRVVVAASVGATVFALALLTGDISPETPASDAMVERSLTEADGRNVVNVILADFRGFDTLGEITVLAAAAIGTVALARAGRRPTAAGAAAASDVEGSPRAEAPAGVPLAHGDEQAGAPPPVRVTRLVTLDTSVRVTFVAVMVGSLYLLFAGHNQPGGGFAGGIVAGSAIALRYIAGGIRDVRRLSRSRPWTVLGAGVLLAASVAVAPLLFGHSVLEGGSWTLTPPLLGTVKLTSALGFDLGVYLVVVGLTLMMFESFGDDPPPEPAESSAKAR